MLRWKHLEISSGFLVLLAALIYFGAGDMPLLAFLACALHELGHLLVIVAMGGRVEKFRLTIVGAEMQLDGRLPLSYPKELCCTLAGPMANLGMAFLASALNLPLWAGMNLVLGCFHLLPILPLDGGRAFAFLCCLFSGADWAARWSARLGRFLSVLLLGAGVVLSIATGGNITLLVLGLWIFNAFGREKGLSTPV